MSDNLTDIVTCAVCGKEIVNAVGRQKYHAKCREALYRRQKKGVPRELVLERARKEILEEERQQNPNCCPDPGCPGFTSAGHVGHCILPRCRGREFWG